MLFKKLFARKNSSPVAATNHDEFNHADRPSNLEIALHPIALLVAGATRY